jgi:hypothetical protein
MRLTDRMNDSDGPNGLSRRTTTMKKLQALGLALGLVALGSVTWAAGSLNSSPNRDKEPRVTGTVIRVNEKDRTFAVEVTFSARNLRALPEVGKLVDVTFTQATPGGPLEATATINNSKSNTF